MKTIGIEAFLRWVYREELPKAEAAGTGSMLISDMFGGGWDAVSRQGELMTECVSDGRVNSYGVVPLPAWYGEPPHPDAHAAHRAINDLSKMDFDVPDGWAKLVGLGLSEDEADDAVRRAMPRIASAKAEGGWQLRFKPAELIRRHAILGDAPCWQSDKPKARFVTMRGMPAWFRMIEVTNALGRFEQREVDGFNPRSRRPYADAYRKTILDPDPAQAAIERAEYEVWHAAMCLLVEILNEPGVLQSHRLGAPLAPAHPWLAVALEETA